MKINAKVNQKSEDGTQTIYQEISRTYVLPDTVQVDKLKSLLSHDGILSIEAPLKGTEPEKSKEPQEIPVSRPADKDGPKE